MPSLSRTCRKHPGQQIALSASPPAGEPCDVGRFPAVGKLGRLPGHDGEPGASLRGRPAQTLQAGYGADDGGPGHGHGHLYLPLPLGHQVGGHSTRTFRCPVMWAAAAADVGLAGAHLAHDHRSGVDLQAQGCAPDGVLLGSHGSSDEAGQGLVLPGLTGPVAGRVSLGHRPGDRVLVYLDELGEAHAPGFFRCFLFRQGFLLCDGISSSWGASGSRGWSCGMSALSG